MRDGIVSKQIKRVLSPAASPADNTAQVGQIIDHQGYDAVSYVILTGALPDADATFTVLLEEGDASNRSDAAAVADADMVSQTNNTAPETAASFTFAADDQVRKLGYIGSKRYSRLTITPAANASASLLAACAILEKAAHEPITQATA